MISNSLFYKGLQLLFCYKESLYLPINNKLKAMKIIILLVMLVFSATFVNALSQVNKSKKQLKAELKAWRTEQIKTVIRNKNFVFKANTVIPKNERTKTLTSDFGIEVKNDSVFSYMPYFGNTYSRDYSSFKDSPMGFMQSIDEYSTKRTRSGYIIRINVKNGHDVIDLKFHISKTGNASVSASSINRQSITYMGIVLIPLPESINQ